MLNTIITFPHNFLHQWEESGLCKIEIVFLVSCYEGIRKLLYYLVPSPIPIPEYWTTNEIVDFSINCVNVIIQPL